MEPLIPQTDMPETHADNPRVTLPLRNPEFQTADKDKYTVLCAQLSPPHFALAEAVFQVEGFQLEVLREADRGAVEEGLRYVNNDVCYPAIIVVGQLIQALKSGRYDPQRTAMLISQTCGGCRSTNYATFLKIAAQKAGFAHVPIIPFNINVTTSENPTGIPVTMRMVNRMMLAMLYGDLLLKLANACRPYELESGATDALMGAWLQKVRHVILTQKRHDVSRLATEIVADFDALPLEAQRNRPKVGIVGEILVKYHPDANNRLVSLIEQEGGEAVVPDILDFVQYCISSDLFRGQYSRVSWLDGIKSRVMVWYVERTRNRVRAAINRSTRFRDRGDFRRLMKRTDLPVSPCNHTGEGWLLTAEMIEMIEHGVPNIVCVQPFACLPNHVTGKGVMKELRARHPHANITAIDYDPGTTEVNQLNRIKLMMAVAMKNMEPQS